MVIQHSSTPALSKEVLYIGSAVPLETSEGLEAIQQPLRSRYPVDNDENVQGILSILSILPSGIQLRYKNDPSHVVLFPFSSLTMCAAVRCVKIINAATNEVSARFVSLSSPEAGGANNQRPAIFTAITRRTKGRQVLECHGFITMTPKDALELVQWTSTLDKRSKQKGLESLKTGASSSAYDVSRADSSFFTETASLPEFPIQLVPGDSVEPVSPATSPAFYKEPPPNGFFYSTKNAQVKKYSLHKFSGAAGADDTHSSIPAGTDHFERLPGYASSHYSTSGAVLPTVPRQPVLVPIHPYSHLSPPLPAYTRPVFVGPPPPPPTMFAYPRPRFFSPPPVMRARPVPVLVPPPVYNDSTYLRAKVGRRGSRESSRSTSPSSIPESAQLNGKPHRKFHPHDETSQSSSRPRTPPTDYDAPSSRGHRVSRKEDFYLRQNVHPASSQVQAARGFKGYYWAPPYGYYSLPHPTGPARPRSVPPYVERREKKSKNKEAKKSKKTKKRSSKKGHHENAHDESTDSVGYTSEIADNRLPRDFRRVENQFKHERAFSKSLAEEKRNSLKGSTAFNAYSLNNTVGNNENDFPPTMY
ncbi:unnamed protein product [Candidula unifasciata]|uniref:PID domain-containing protein n=1 Tax=Candidula unifasciata TaxID=100452 RepID=A0A8S4A251_9EUPU|nr:unnamed protein product [Candidula unifasciata]